MFGNDPEASAKACVSCQAVAAEWVAQPDGKRFTIAKGECWRACDALHMGLVPPDFETRKCLAPCPKTSERGEEILMLVGLASRQVRAGFSGAYGLDWNVIARLADDFKIDTADAEWWEDLATVEGVLVECLNPPKPEEA